MGSQARSMVQDMLSTDNEREERKTMLSGLPAFLPLFSSCRQYKLSGKSACSDCVWAGGDFLF